MNKSKLLKEWPRGLKYSPQTGLFYSNRNKAKSGMLPLKCTTSQGYGQIRINDKLHATHRLAFLAMAGEMPSEGKEVDHINGKRNDNRWSNLRLVSDRSNSINKKLHRDGKLVGCYFNKKHQRFLSEITFEKKAYYLGMYDTEQEAHAAYMSAFTEIETTGKLTPRFDIHDGFKKDRLVGAFLGKKGKYRSQIRHNGKITHLGTFETELLAHEAFVKARSLLTNNQPPEF